jgi:peptidoglycan/xylan/chitin deacetylase (PgdA/CDA1 family)
VVDEALDRAVIEGGAADLKAITGQAPVLFAYPNGRPGQDFDERHPAMVRSAGFRFAFTTRAGVAAAGTDPYLLPRFTPWDRSALRFQARMLRNLFERVQA